MSNFLKINWKNMKLKTKVLTVLAAAVLCACGGQDAGEPSQSGDRSTVLLATVVGNTATFTGIRDNYVVVVGTSGTTVTDSTGFEQPASLASSVTELKFADRSVALGIESNAAKIYRLYRAAFGRVPDLAGLGYYLDYVNSGSSFESVASGMIGSDEFVQKHGWLTDTQFVNVLYTNIQGRPADADTTNTWVTRLSQDMSRATLVFILSEGEQTRAQVASAITNGIDYIPYGTNPLNRKWAKDVAVGGRFTCALTSTSGVECWGVNQYGELGDGTTTWRATPAPVSGLASGVKQIAAGEDFACALTDNAEIKCWGAGAKGQIGSGSFASPIRQPLLVKTPVGAASPATPIQISAGRHHACMLTAAGEVFCWGANESGQLGNGLVTNSAVPVAAKNDSLGNKISQVKQVSSGGQHNCVLTTSGGVKCFGSNTSAQLGNGTKTASKWPIVPTGLSSGVSSISAGIRHSCASLANGLVKCWGLDDKFQLGIVSPSTLSVYAPVQVEGLSGVTRLANGSPSAESVCAVISGALPKCWGANNYAQLGTDVASARSLAISTGADLQNATKLMVGLNHACAVSNTGGLKCWGSNLFGELGTGTSGGTIFVKQNVVGFN